MQKKALVIIDIQNDITKHYKDIIDNINKAVDWAVSNDIHVVYIRHEAFVAVEYPLFDQSVFVRVERTVNGELRL